MPDSQKETIAMKKYRFSDVELSMIEKSCIPMAVYQFVDKRVVTLALSEGFLRLFGYERSEAYPLMDSNMYKDTHPDDISRIADAAFRFATEGGEYNVVYRTRFGEEYRIIHAHGEHFFTEDGTRLAAIWYNNEGSYSDDLGEFPADPTPLFRRMLREETLFHRSYYDPLTGLPNMSYFFELAEAGRASLNREGKPTALLFFNLSGMKFFNSRHGFAAGDELLKSFARVLVRHFSNENCSRFGQDHFAVFTACNALEDTLRDIFAECQSLHPESSVPIHVGIYLDDTQAVSISTACDRAKYACDLNRDSYVSSFRYFDISMIKEAETRQYIITHLDRAIRENWIQVYYQAIVRASNGKVCDEEALSRWNDPERGLLSPSEFIPALEDSRLIYKLDLYVLDQILKKLKVQEDAGLYIVPQSLNLSRADFDVIDIVEEIRRRVDDAGIPREKLTIEVTESVVGSDFEFMREQILRFQALGFKVWMDDFGSGYSSLDLLQNIRFDLIKFDMRFMQQLETSAAAKIILTELMKMTLSLGIDSLAEGVETQAQLEFLQEVGCSKLQGYYFTKPVPMATILERNQNGTQIGFENPEEADYFASLARINLYDLTSVASENQESIQRFTHTIPMAVIETKDQWFRVTRCNATYRAFVENSFAYSAIGVDIPFDGEHAFGSAFLSAIQQCRRNGNLILLDETDDGKTTHTMIRRIAVDPVTGTAALAVAILAVTDDSIDDAPITYVHIAKALSSDYRYLYYVDLDTEDFVEYSSDSSHQDLSVERHGADFFATSRADALRILHKDDQEAFRRAFTKENVVGSIDVNGSFTITYRLLERGEARYMSMKAVRMHPRDSRIIIGVNDVNAQKLQEEALERIRSEQKVYRRVMALSDEYVCLYTVDLDTDHYVEYRATEDYDVLGLSKEGDDFFGVAVRESAWALFEEDAPRFAAAFSKKDILRTIEQTGQFVLHYRLMIRGKPCYVRLKAAMLRENDGPKLIVGVENVDAQVKREQEHDRNRSIVHAQINLDPLTGVKSRTAYEAVEQQLNYQLANGIPVDFSVALFDVKSSDEAHPVSDEGVKRACSTICDTFKRSPVFRIEDRRFVVIAHGQDHENMDELMRHLAGSAVRLRAEEGLRLAYGMAKHDAEPTVAEVCRHAEAAMIN